VVATPERRVIAKNVKYEDSDLHNIPGGKKLHRRLYPRPGE
jgi:hypothetical protein